MCGCAAHLVRKLYVYGQSLWGARPSQSVTRSLYPQCLKNLKEIGFQIGSGVMIGLPGQKLRDLASDLTFFRQQEFDMIGMGPFITVWMTHQRTRALRIHED
jgi:hypothetical protein